MVVAQMLRALYVSVTRYDSGEHYDVVVSAFGSEAANSSQAEGSVRGSKIAEVVEVTMPHPHVQSVYELMVFSLRR